MEMNENTWRRRERKSFIITVEILLYKFLLWHIPGKDFMGRVIKILIFKLIKYSTERTFVATKKVV